MNGPPRSNNPEMVSLREYLESRIDGLSLTMTATATALDKRLEGMNEFRQAMNDQRINLESRIQEGVPRAEYAVQHRTLEAQVNAITAEFREWRANQEGKASQVSVFIVGAITVVGWLIAIGFGVAGLILR
jgi:predicted phage tail protein